MTMMCMMMMMMLIDDDDDVDDHDDVDDDDDVGNQSSPLSNKSLPNRQPVDPTRWGSGSFHAMPAGSDGVMTPWFCQAVLIRTRTNCIRSTSTHTSTSDSMAIGITI